MNTTDILNPSCPWYDMEQQFGPANVKWCEERLCSWVNEPANAWSNIFFMLVGLFLIYRGYKARHELQVKQRGNFDFHFGLVTFVMGFCSFAYHASNNYLSQILDFIGMYLYIYFLLTISLYHLKMISSKAAISFFAGCVILSTALIPIAQHVHFPYQAIILIAAVSIAILQTKIWRSQPNYPKKDLLLSLAAFVIGAAFSYSDVSRRFCEPGNHFIQGHAIWHVFCAVGTWFSYRLFSKQIKSVN